ncbi:MAG: putative C-S lyase [Gammaproteobacteria bacterium]|nr:putative C-S lyase [Gammaproteobacteria bacterium]
MTTFNFDEIIERRSTGSLKWNYYDEDILPLWVADSDFKCAPAILSGISERVEHGILGYQIPSMNNSATAAVVSWLWRRHSWQIKAEWVVWVPGVVTAVNGTCRAFCKPGDKVLIQEPNYGPLLDAPELNNLIKETVNTCMKDGRWTFDFDDLERKASDPKARMFILCNPMNPCGSVLTADELARIEAICLQHDVMLCSDEIHCDLILDDVSHIPAGSLSEIGSQCITIMAASKTFNIAGLASSYVIIPDEKIRQQFIQTTISMQLWVNVLGMIATEKALTECDDWYESQLDYLRGNRQYLKQAFKSIDGFDYKPAAATFLAWIDASTLDAKDVHQYMLSKGVGPTAGEDFGRPNFTRINFACPRSYLEQAIERLT